jgi:hypothetical protein
MIPNTELTSQKKTLQTSNTSEYLSSPDHLFFTFYTDGLSKEAMHHPPSDYQLEIHTDALHTMKAYRMEIHLHSFLTSALH